MTNRRPSAGFWAAVFLLSLPLVYVASFAPACGLVARNKLPELETARFYRPLVRGASAEIPLVSAPLRWWGELFHTECRIVTIIDQLDADLEMDDFVDNLRNSR